jgi:hypothetical protein
MSFCKEGENCFSLAANHPARHCSAVRVVCVFAFVAAPQAIRQCEAEPARAAERRRTIEI